MALGHYLLHVMRLSMLCPTIPHPGAFGVIMGELTKKFRPIQGHLTLSRTIRICDEYGFRGRGAVVDKIPQGPHRGNMGRNGDLTTTLGPEQGNLRI